MKNMNIDVTAGQLTICYSTSICPLECPSKNENLFDRSNSISEDFIKELSLFVNLLYVMRKRKKRPEEEQCARVTSMIIITISTQKNEEEEAVGLKMV